MAAKICDILNEETGWMWVGIDLKWQRASFVCSNCVLESGPTGWWHWGVWQRNIHCGQQQVTSSKSVNRLPSRRKTHNAKFKNTTNLVPYMWDMSTLICVNGFVKQALDFRLTQIWNMCHIGLPFYFSLLRRCVPSSVLKLPIFHLL